MTDERAIRDRLYSCIDSLPMTLKEIAHDTGINYSYLSQLRTKDNPEIKASLIATVCKKYGFSPAFILLGVGATKGGKQAGSPQLDRIEHILDKIITTMLESMLASNHTNQVSDLQKLINEARKRRN